MTDIGPTVDIGSIPWSRRGSFMTLTTLERVSEHPGREAAVEPGLYLHDVSGNRLFRWNGVFRLEGLEDGVVQPLEVRSATPDRLELATPSGAVEVTWDGPDTLRFRGRGTGLRLTQAVIDPFGAAVAFPLGERSWRLLMGMDAHYAATALEGELRVEAPRSRTGAAADGALEADRKVVDVLPGPAGAFELALSQYESGYLEPAAWQSFDDCEAGVGAEFSDWLASRPPVPAGLEAARALAAYVGPATESPSSPLYEPDGYWRGPVWAPTTLLLVDGLDACGEHELAADVARRFVETCRRSGFAENYDAHTGEPLRDPAYTWSASVFTVLAGRPDQR